MLVRALFVSAIAWSPVAAAQDADGDGFSPPADCNDTDPSVFPGAIEIAGDGVDQDCDRQELCYADADLDGARSATILLSTDADCNDAGEGLASDPLDCNDTDPDIRPGAAEIAGDNVDQNCDLVESCYDDSDNDGARTHTTVTSADADCNDAFEGLATDAIDCDDSDPSVHPAAVDICADGIDQDCDGSDETLRLFGPLPGVADGPNSWVATCATPGTSVSVAASISLGSTPVPGCAPLSSDLSGPTVIGSIATSALGQGILTLDVPAAAAGTTVHFQGLDPAACALSDVTSAAF